MIMKSDLESIYRCKNNDDLCAIFHSQDFRPDARKLAWSLLRERDISENAINHWRDPTVEIAPPIWSSGISESELRRMVNRQRNVAYISTLFFLSLLICCPLGFLIVLFFADLWHTPLRILLLRPFDFPYSQAGTINFVNRYLRCLGHTYTLADTQIMPHSAFESALMPRWIQFGLYRSFKIRWDDDVLSFKGFIGSRVECNLAWAISPQKLFKVSCTLETWRRTVQHLINSTQLIIVDLSYANEGLKWELNEVQFYGATNKMIFVTHEYCLNWARSFWETYGLSEYGELFVYNKDGLAARHKELSDKLISVAIRSSTAN